MPAEAPAAKRQRTSGSAEPSGACARAHAFVPDSPLSPSKTATIGSPVLPKHNAEITESPDASGAEEANFAVRTDSELEPAQTSPHQLVQDSPEVLGDRAATEQQNGLHKSHASSRPPDSNGDPQSQSTEPEATSQQQSTAGPDTSAPSTTSYETNLVPAAVVVNSPSTPHISNDHTTAPAGEAASMPAATQPTPKASVEHITVSQLLLAGPYQVDAQQQERLAHNLRVYKAKVDEVHALGRVSQTWHDNAGYSQCCDCHLAPTDAAAAQHIPDRESAMLFMPAAKARHDRLQRAQGAASPKKDAWAHSGGGGGGLLWRQG